MDRLVDYFAVVGCDQITNGEASLKNFYLPP